MTPALGLPIAYLAGSIPTAYLAGRLLKGIDLRTVGSGNLGATNVYRALGFKAAAVVFLVDFAKGALPVYFLPRLLGDLRPGSDAFTWWSLAFGTMTILGHAKPVFLLWKGGGKGVATGAGVFLALAAGPMLTALAVFIFVLWASGYVSLGSLMASAVLPVFVFLDQGATPVFFASVAIAAFVFWTHRANIERLKSGTEHRFSRKKGVDS
jgi:glycerol-3-phosphate acyltransferase PlsY